MKRRTLHKRVSFPRLKVPQNNESEEVNWLKNQLIPLLKEKLAAARRRLRELDYKKPSDN